MTASTDKATTSTVAQTTPTLPPTTTTTLPPSPQQGTATPGTGLKDGDTITVAVTGFLPKPKNPVGINECAQKGDASVDTPDCAIDHIAILTINADGTGTATFKVLGANVGSAKHSCLDADTRCFLSVGELSADPKVERTDDIDLEFAG
jgi:Neocarzinostatin family.